MKLIKTILFSITILSIQFGNSYALTSDTLRINMACLQTHVGDGDDIIYGPYASQSEAYEAALQLTSNPYWMPLNQTGNLYTLYGCIHPDDGNKQIAAYEIFGENNINTWFVAGIAWDGVIDTDTDGDGIPDQRDMYPDDPTPYSIKLVTYYTDDGTETGTHVGEIWVTDRGDYFSFGDLPEDGLGGFYVPSGTWQDPSDGEGLSSGAPSSTDGSGINNPTYSADIPTGDAPQDNEPTGQSGTGSDGTETDNQALHGIMDNTGAVADNTKRQLDYMKDLNQAIQNMDRNLAMINDDLTTSDSGEITAQDIKDAFGDAESDKNNFESVSVSDSYSGISGELVEGEDYQLPGELADESFISDFFSSNPLISAFNNSGFEVSSSTPTATLDLGYLGSHQIDLTPLESGFQLAGNMLFALCSIGSLIMVVRG